MPEIVTFGCRLNAFESQVIGENARRAGLRDVVVVNTCAVTHEAVRQARQAIRRLRRENPKKTIIVTGCAAQLEPEAFAAMAEVDRVIGNAEKLDARFLGPEGGDAVSDIMAVKETAGPLVDAPLVRGFGARTRAFCQIQQGCDHRCTFCVIPFARGPSRSVAPGRVVGQVRRLVERGYKEVVLTGVDICSYGADLAGHPRLGALVGELLARVPALARLRLGSLDPAAIDEDLYRVLAEEPRLMPHLHLSLQAADDLVLKRMRRRHSRKDAEAVVARARRARADVVFGADLIAGFPTETEAMFARTLSAVDDLGLTYLHVFPFSARPGTPAGRMPQVAVAERKERAQRLRAAAEKARARFFQGRIGAPARVLVEKNGAGLSEHYAPVRLAFEADPGALVSVRIIAAEADHLIGERAA